jgi:long-chain acyl-CoA synthetase
MPFEPRFRTLVDIYNRAIGTFGDRELFGTKRAGRWTWTTYAEFGSMVERFRAGLASIGIQRGDCVALVADNRVEWAVAAHACFGLGAAFVPMYQAQNAQEWEFIVRDCEAKALIVANDAILAETRGLLDSVASLGHVILLDAPEPAAQGRAPGERVTNGQGAADGAVGGDERIRTYASLCNSGGKVPSLDPSPEDLATLVYTSGTTGKPKGVMLTHANIAANVSAVHDVFPIGPDDRSLSFLPWAHVFGQTVELCCLFSVGGSLAICESIAKIIDNLAEVRPTLLFSVPRIFNRIYTSVNEQLANKPKPLRRLVAQALEVTAKERAGQRLRLRELALIMLADRLVFRRVRARFGGRLKYAFAGGAALSRQVAEFIDTMGIVVYEGYGLTETSPIATANVPGSRKIGSVGRPIPGVRIDIDPSTSDKKQGDVVTPGRIEGEVIVYGHNVMKGYLKRPEENAAVFTRDGGFRTGDMGYIDVHGFLFITGRIKEQYKLENGKYVVPTPLEEQLKLSLFVTNAMVYGDNRPYNVALIVANIAAVRAWAERNHVVLPASTESILNDERVRALFKKEIEKYAAEFKGFESIREFALIDQDFTTENDMLTPSLKLRRRKVIDVYGPLLERMYSSEQRATRANAVAE